MGKERFIAIPVDPVGKPRMTQRDKWKQRPCVMRYRAFADRLREECGRHQFVPPESGLSITFFLPMPSSWSQKKKARMWDKPHQQKPDWDNLVKSVFDALLKDDSKVWSVNKVEKRWAYRGSIEFIITPTIQEGSK